MPNSKKSVSWETREEVSKYDVPQIIHGQALAEAIATAMSKGLEPLLAAKETKRSHPSIAGSA